MSLPVLDDERLRAVSGGNAELEIELVDMLIEEAEPLVADLEKQGERHDREAAHELSHSLKGIAGNIGAIELRDAAAELDSVLTEEASPWARFGDYLARIAAALNDVREARASRGAALGQ